MRTEILCVGTEILLGNIVNTNAAYLARQCAELGLTSYYQTVVGDNEERLMEALKIAAQRSELILLSGGLGPTEDDLTKEVCAKFAGKKLVMHDGSKERIAAYFSARGLKPTDNNWKQAMIPMDSVVFENNNGTAPGLAMTAGEVKMILLPGPPNELIPMFEESVKPYLQKLSNDVILSQMVKLCGVSESAVETQIKDLIDGNTNPTLATYAKTGEVHVRVTAKAESQKEAQKLVKPVVKELKRRFEKDIYTTEADVTLEKAVVDLLIANNMSITCAESCTGGLLSARLISVPGVSEVYKAGFITYSNKAKRKLLGVKKGTLQKYGAVSEQTAYEMVKGLLDETKTDVGIAITGLAGPGGATPEKPIGLVYIACNIKGTIVVHECHFKGNREKIQESSTSYAMMLARQCLLEYISKVTFGKKE